jgi:hypothetical protein
MQWVALLAGCAVGLGISLVEYHFVRPSESTATIIITTRAAFIPLVVASAFVISAPLDTDLVETLPAPQWLTTVGQLLFALPAMGITAWIQLELTAAELRITEPATAHLPWPSLVSELAAWSAFSIAGCAIVGRTRWGNQLAGAIAAPAALAVVAVLALLPFGLFPTTPGPTRLSPQSAAWLRSDWEWCAMLLAAVVAICGASRDRWRRPIFPRA